MNITDKHLTEREYAAILKRAMNIGEMMLKSGSEVGRIEDTISRICLAYGALRADVLTITSSIIVTLETPDGDNITHTRRITSRDYDMMKLESLNRLSRTVCETCMPVEEIDRQLAEIDKIRHLPWFVTLFAFLISASSFCVFFGGTWRDALAVLLPAAIMGVAVWGIMKLLGALSVGQSRLILCGVPVAVGVIVYAVGIVLFKAIRREDCMLLPKGDKISKILRL